MAIYRKRYLFCILYLMLIIPLSARGQSSVWNKDGDKRKKGQKTAKSVGKIKGFKEHLKNWGLDTNYSQALLLGGKLNSDGWSGSFYFVKKKTYRHKNFWQLHFSEIKHEKQTKQKSTKNNYPQFGNNSPYVFGKINNLYTLQVGFGKEHLLLPAVIDGNLSISFRYNLGLSLAMLKPYYLKLIYRENNGGTDTVQLEQHKYSLADTAAFLNPANIFGSSKWEKGLNQIDYVPGGYFEASLAIIPGKNKSFVQVVTLGVNAAFYSKPLTIMAEQEAYNWQASLFIGLAIGKRW